MYIYIERERENSAVNHVTFLMMSSFYDVFYFVISDYFK